MTLALETGVAEVAQTHLSVWGFTSRGFFVVVVVLCLFFLFFFKLFLWFVEV